MLHNYIFMVFQSSECNFLVRGLNKAHTVINRMSQQLNFTKQRQTDKQTDRQTGQTRADQSRPDQTRADQTRAEQTRAEQTRPEQHYSILPEYHRVSLFFSDTARAGLTCSRLASTGDLIDGMLTRKRTQTAKLLSHPMQ